MRYKEKIATLLCVIQFVLLVCGCNAETSAEMPVDNLFTQPATETAGDTTISTGSDEYDDLKVPSTGYFGLVPTMGTETDGDRTYFVYSGGEFHYPFSFMNQGNSFGEYGLGFLLFVDGIPQPYRMNDAQEESYMQVIYPGQSTDLEPLEYEFVFTPVSGSQGECVEFSVAIVQYPWYYAEASRGIQNTTCLGISHVTLYFEDNPPVQTMPEFSDRLLSYTVSYEDLTDADIAGYSSAELNSILDWSFSADGKAQGIHYNITENDTVNIHYELFGCKEMEYSLILFADNEPVYTDPAQTHVVARSGEKTVIDMQVDLSDFDGRCLVYVVLICRNYWELSSQGVAFSGPSIIASYSVYYVSEASFS